MIDLKDVSKMTDAEREIRLGVDAQTRANNCLVDIKNALHKWQCSIEPLVQISGLGTIKGNYMVVPMVVRPTGLSNK